MRLYTFVGLGCLAFISFGRSASGQLYWDIDGANPGAGGATPAGTWDTGITPNWTSDSTGSSAATTWIDGNDAVFAAGSDATGAYAVTLGGTVLANSISFEDGDATISGGTELDLSGAASINVTSPASGTISSVVGGTAGLTKNGNGTLALSGPNTYSGTTNVSAGILSVSNATSLGAVDSTVVASGASLNVSGSGVTMAEPINIQGTGSTGTNGALFKSGSGTTTLSGLVTLDADALINGTAGTLTMTGGVGGSANLTVGGTNAVTISTNALSNGGNLTKVGSNTLTLSASNSYSGTTDIQAGVVAVSNASGLGSTGAATTVQSGAALNVNGGVTIAEPITINGTGISGAGALRHTASSTTISGGVTVGTSGARINSDASTLTISTANITGTNTDLTIGGAGATTISSSSGILTGTGILTKDGAGTLTLSSNASNWSGGTIITAGVVSIPSISATPNALGVPSSTITLDGGTLKQTNTGNAGSFVSATRNIMVTANGGLVSYDDGSATNFFSSIYIPNAGKGIFGVGGTPTAGVGTLTKTGPDEFRVQGAELVNFSFEKLVVIQGLYRIGSTGTPTTNGDRGFGATPAAPMADAITLINGGGIGTSLTLTLSANRGITFGAGGGTFYPVGGVTTTIPGPISGSGKMTVGVSGAAFSSGNYILSNAGNTTSFTGSVEMNCMTLTLNGSLNATNLSGNATGTSAGDISVASGKTFTAGSDNTSTSYPGRIIGSGTFTKVGSGTLTLNSAGTGNQWTNTGGVLINAGKILYTTNSGLADTVPVTVNGTGATPDLYGTLDMSDPSVVPDTFGSLISSSGNTFGQVLQGAANITLGQTATTARSYSGTITATTGTFTKAGGTFTQTLAGNNTLGDVNVNLGRLNFNGTDTTGAVTVASTATLGGTGSVSGAINVQSGGTLAPGASIGAFRGGALTMASGSTFQYELNSSGTPTADLQNINGALSLGGATLTGTDLAAVSTALSGGTKFTLFSYSGAWDNSTFSGLNNGDPVTIGANTFNIKYDDTTGGVNTGSLYTNFVTLAIPGAAGVPGDYNHNGVVDAADYVVWRKQLGTAGPDADGNGSGLVDNSDYDYWRARFGNVSGAGAGLSGSGGAVPEPTGLALFAIGLIGLAFRRREQRTFDLGSGFPKSI